MTIRELIQQLHTYPLDATIEVNDPEGTMNYPHVGLDYSSDTHTLEIFGYFGNEAKPRVCYEWKSY
jgi:hypothetical protein